MDDLNPLPILLILYLAMAVLTIILLFTRPRQWGSLPASIYLVNMAHGGLLVVGTYFGRADLLFWAFALVSLTYAQLGGEVLAAHARRPKQP